MLQTYPTTAGHSQGVYTQSTQLSTPLGKLCAGRRLWWGTRVVKGKGIENATSHPYSSRSTALQEGQGWNQTYMKIQYQTVCYFNKLLCKTSLLCFTSMTNPGGTQPCSPCTSPKQAMQSKRLLHLERAFPLQVRISVFKEKKNIFIPCCTEDRKGSQRDKLEDPRRDCVYNKYIHKTTTHPQKLSA